MECIYCKKQFKTWKSVRGHTSHCTKNTGEYFIDLNYGPIHYTDCLGLSGLQFKHKYPNLKTTLSNIIQTFIRKGFVVDIKTRNIWNKTTILNSIKDFYSLNNRIPQIRDFEKTNGKYPNRETVKDLFGTWNTAIQEAGFIPNVQNGFGLNTYGDDGILYRSRYEADFSNKFLYNKYEYYIEPKYPEPFNKYYDWYIKDLDLYIELDGEIRPEVIENKIKINKELNRSLLVVKTSEIDKFNTLIQLQEAKNVRRY